MPRLFPWRRRHREVEAVAGERPRASEPELQSPARPRPPAPSSSSDSARLARNVPLLGFTALFNDVASEMAYWVLPYFLTRVLGAGPELLGLIEGVAESAASLVRVYSGHLTDRRPRRKPLVVLGYFIGNAVKPLLGFTTAWSQVLALRAADRGGKGLRGAPRDVMITESAGGEKLGAAFGLRQALDTVGAVVGPALAFWIMARTHNVRVVFWLAAIPGGITVALAWGGLRETSVASAATAAVPAAPARPRAQAGCAAKPRWGPRQSMPVAPPSGAFYALLAAVGLFGLANFSDMFLILRAQQWGVAPALAPLLGLVFNVVFAALSYPFGRLSDRWPRARLVGVGYLIFALDFWAFARAGGGWIWALFAVYGLYQALSAGVLSALVADLVPPAARGRAYGWMAAVAGVTALLASLLAGWLWRGRGPAAPFELSAALAAAAAVILFTLPGRSRRPECKAA